MVNNVAYAKDISRKIFTVKQNQRLKGEFVGNIPPYGYEKSVEDGHKLVINEETAPVIRKIFQLKEQKKTNTEIAKILEEEREIAPMTYWYRNYTCFQSDRKYYRPGKDPGSNREQRFAFGGRRVADGGNFTGGCTETGNRYLLLYRA